MKSNELKNKIDAALNSINNIEPVNPSPYFYTKALAKLNRTNVSVWEKWSAIFLRPAVAFATICFIIVINAFVLYSKYDSKIKATDQTELASSDEYSDTVTGLYDLENTKP